MRALRPQSRRPPSGQGLRRSPRLYGRRGGGSRLASETRDLVRRVQRHVFPEEGITNELLHNLVKGFTSGDYKGLYSCDGIPSSIATQKRFVIIVNLASKRSRKPGHFVVIAGRPGKVLYFDSYGFPPLQEAVVRFLRDCLRPLQWCKYQIQPTNSALCPLYAMFMALYLDWRPWDKKTIQFEWMFRTDDLKHNDKVISHYVKCLIDKISDRRRRGLGKWTKSS